MTEEGRTDRGPQPARNLRLVIEYDGTAYAGWQRQANAPTIQQHIEEAVERMTGARCVLHGSGRTDAGVHARAQVANFTTDADIPVRGFLKGLNVELPRDIAIVSVDEVPADFEARRSARGKHYAYRVWNRDARSPFHDRFSWHIYNRLDVAAMNAAARPLLGEHDFSAFRAAECDAKTPVRTVRRLDVVTDGDLVVIHAEATAFLRNMVRVIAGTLIEVGRGMREVGSVADALASKDRERAGRTAPAHGLTLERVFYQDPR